MTGDSIKVRKWEGSPITTCNLCGEVIEHTFIDGRVHGRGWAIMCPLCHLEVGIGLGVGRGQYYRRDGSLWIKIAG